MSNFKGKKGLKQEEKKETEKELIDKLTAIKIQNEKDGLKEIQAILEKRNLEIVTQVPVHIQGQLLGVVVKSK